MLVAQLNGRLIEAQKVSKDTSKKSQANFICPQCRQSVILKRGQYRIAHFSHRDLSDCPYSESESAAHQAGKLRFQADISEIGHLAFIERDFDAIKQRADVYVPDWQLVFEYQCSPISFTEIKRRTAGYQQVAADVIWIVGDRHATGRYRREQIAKFARFNDRLGFYFVSYSSKTRLFGLHYFIQEVAGKVVAEVQKFSNLRALMAFMRTSQTHYSQQIGGHFQARQRILHQLRTIQESNLRRAKTYLSSVNACYAAGRQFVGCPMICHGQAGGGLPIVKQGVLGWKVWLVLQLFERGQQDFSTSELEAIFEAGCEQFLIEFAQVRVGRQLMADRFRQFIRDCRSAGYLRYTISGIAIISRPQWFDDYDQKRRFILTNRQLL